MHDLVLAMTGASGAPYGVRLLEVLLRAGRRVHLVLSPAAVQVIEQEMDRRVRLDDFRLEDLLGSAASAAEVGQVKHHDYQDFLAGIASGTFLTDGMVICPCSMGTAAAVAHGLSQNLIHRAADVHLKERRKLILVPRETPLGLVQLRNLSACAEAGAIVLPAMPAFYTRPQNLGEAIDFVVGRICDQLGIEHQLLRRWGVSEDEPAASAGCTVHVEVSVGELIDKITILEIKSERIGATHKLANVRRELETLRRAAQAVPTSERLTQLTDELRAVNETLWTVEDEIRRCEARSDFGAAFIELARSVYRHNDHRAALKRQVNDLVGSRLTEEKSYGS
jgi:flavin prenyltransferase